MSLYHKDIYMPEKVTSLQLVTFDRLEWGFHALNSLEDDRNGIIQFFDSITFDGSNVIEAEFKNGKVIKLVVRLPYNDDCDIVTVIASIRGKKTVKTVWLNSKDDNHETLNDSIYERC